MWMLSNLVHIRLKSPFAGPRNPNSLGCMQKPTQLIKHWAQKKPIKRIPPLSFSFHKNFPLVFVISQINIYSLQENLEEEVDQAG